MVSSNNSGVISTSDTATVDSVGPYVLIIFTSGNLSCNFFVADVVSTSPQNKNTLRFGIIVLQNFLSAKHISAKDGVETHTLRFASSK